MSLTGALPILITTFLASVVEVVEHLDPPRLSAFERVLFEFAKPRTIVLTTPNREYNVTWENVGPERFRHPDHRFEWTRQEFQDWANGIVARFGYRVRFVAVGSSARAALARQPDRAPPSGRMRAAMTV